MPCLVVIPEQGSEKKMRSPSRNRVTTVAFTVAVALRIKVVSKVLYNISNFSFTVSGTHVVTTNIFQLLYIDKLK